MEYLKNTSGVSSTENSPFIAPASSMKLIESNPKLLKLSSSSILSTEIFISLPIIFLEAEMIFSLTADLSKALSAWVGSF